MAHKSVKDLMKTVKKKVSEGMEEAGELHAIPIFIGKAQDYIYSAYSPTAYKRRRTFIDHENYFNYSFDVLNKVFHKVAPMGYTADGNENLHILIELGQDGAMSYSSSIPLYNEEYIRMRTSRYIRYGNEFGDRIPFWQPRPFVSTAIREFYMSFSDYLDIVKKHVNGK